MFTCKICGLKFRYIACHLRKHKITVIDYYLDVLKKERTFCLKCGKPTRFLNVQDGFAPYCCRKCSHTSDIVKKKMAATNLERYGTENVYASQYGKQKIAETNLMRYGAENVFASDIIKKKISVRSMEKYNTSNPGNSDAGRKKAYETMRKNGLNSSNEVFFEGELKRLGIQYEVQYLDKRYPFNCDFYLPEKDCFIELNLYWSHGGHWYNNDDKVQKWKSKNTAHYDNAINVFTNLDVQKREAARKHNLNYIVFWNYKDIDLWLALAMPNGKDWDVEYSWLPKRQLTHDIIWPKSIKKGHIIKIAKKANFYEFYKREIELWSNNGYLHSGTVQSNLYHNRLTYLNKLPNQLTNFEIVRGLGLSKQINSYSAFNVDGLLQFIDKYNITSIYDFCAGWGERLVCCALKNIDYFGIDINEKVIEGHKEIINFYGLTNQSSCVGNSEVDVNTTNSMAVFTCPPYFDKEIYSEHGAENKSKEDFLVWWKTSIQNAINSHTQYFAYQINQQYKDILNSVIDLELIDEIQLKIQSSHMNKHSKKEFESIFVFRKEAYA